MEVQSWQCDAGCIVTCAAGCIVDSGLPVLDFIGVISSDTFAD